MNNYQKSSPETRKLNHVKKDVQKLQKALKKLVTERQFFSRTEGRGFILLRSGINTGWWEFIQGEIAVVFDSGLKTATNEIAVWKEGEKLSFHNLRELKIIQKNLRALKNSLEKLPLRRHRSEESLLKPAMPNLPLMGFDALRETFVEGEVISPSFILEECGWSSKGLYFFTASFPLFGRMIWLEGEAPCWYSPLGDDASPEQIAEMVEILNTFILVEA